jgi:adenylate kinase
MAEGELVPDELVITMILEQLEDGRHGCVLDGFPRTLGQAEALSDAVDITAALLFDAPDDTIVQRIAGRRRCSRRCSESQEPARGDCRSHRCGLEPRLRRCT